MTEDQVTARLQVLEVATMTMFGIMLANSPNDPSYQKANALIGHFTSAVQSGLGDFTPAVRTIGTSYAEHLASILRENLRTLRGEAGATH